MDEREVNLMYILKKIWSGRLLILAFVLVFTILGVYNALSSPAEYTVSTIMVPQMSNTGKSQLSGLASLAGLDLGMTQSSELSPIIYPKIVNSVPFKLELMNTPIHFNGINKPLSLLEYYTKYKKLSKIEVIKKYTLGLPSLIIHSFSTGRDTSRIVLNKVNDHIIYLNKNQKKIISQLGNIISLAVDKKEGFLTLTVVFSEPLAAAEIAQVAQDLLQREIIKLKVEKSRADLNFIQDRYDVVKAEAEGYQIKVATNTDRFKSLTSSLPQINTTRIQTKYGIASGVFQELAKQLEQAKIQVKRDTPVFTVIEPVSIPTDKSAPSRFLIILSWVIIGFVFGVSFIFIKYFIKDFKLKWSLNK